MPELIEDSLDSRLLNRRIRYRAVLPTGYNIFSDKEYPVLYLLHGLFGSCDNFLDLTRVVEYARGAELIIVFPEGENGWYSDSRTIADNKFESYLGDEFFPEIEKRYRIIADGGGRAVAGISMGGYGAFKIALKKPSAFVFAASMSGAFDAASRLPSDSIEDWNILGESLIGVFGERKSPAKIAPDDLFKVVEKASTRTIEKMPNLYFDCGTEDSFIGVNRRMAKLLETKNIPFEYREIEGGAHDWNYWNRQLAVVMAKAIGALADCRLKDK